jgi:hypothetical protein
MSEAVSNGLEAAEGWQLWTADATDGRGWEKPWIMDQVLSTESSAPICDIRGEKT